MFINDFYSLAEQCKPPSQANYESQLPLQKYEPICTATYDQIRCSRAAVHDVC